MVKGCGNGVSAHNPEVAGSSPAPATLDKKRLHRSLFVLIFCMANAYHFVSAVVLMPADLPMRLYIVTFVNGSPRMPSWMAHERKRMLSTALGERNGEPSSFLRRSSFSENPRWMCSINFRPC